MPPNISKHCFKYYMPLKGLLFFKNIRSLRRTTSGLFETNNLKLETKRQKSMSLKSRKNITTVTQTAFGQSSQDVLYTQKCHNLTPCQNLKCSWEETLQNPGKVPGPQNVIVTQNETGGQGKRKGRRYILEWLAISHQPL